MSYNTRRSGGFGPGTPNQSQGQGVGNIGQRRPVVTNNFVPGGQLNPQNKGGVPSINQQQIRQPHVHNPNPSVNFRSQNQGYQTQQQQPTQQQPPLTQQTQQPQPSLPQPQQQQQVQQTIKPEAQATILPGANPPNPSLDGTNGDSMDVDGDVPKKKPFWAKGGKISKKEKMRRRNLRLSKMLQPKNAVMILNELVKNTSYCVEEIPIKTDSNQFKASVLVDSTAHTGFGRSKIQAKNAAAEAALKHYIKTNKLSEIKKDEEGNERMEVAEDETQPPLPWQHVASFALYKLFTFWGEDPNKAPNKLPLPISSASSEVQKPHENRPAKKMPANPETLNPLMLINQMLPHAQFEEVGKSGVPPNVTYSFRCNVDDQNFIGTGPNKKAAKKMAAFGACHKILNIAYPKDIYIPIY